MTRIALAVAAALWALAWSELRAASTEAQATTGAPADLEHGAALAEGCTVCHGAEGLSIVRETPHLAGQHARYMVTALEEYRDGTRDDVNMKEMAAELSMEDMMSVAAYFASLEPFNLEAGPSVDDGPASGGEGPDRDRFAAAREATEECAACHGEDGNAEFPGMPRLAGQHVGSLESALRAYRDGTRVHEEMNDFAAPLGDGDIGFMARYYASVEPKHLPMYEAGKVTAGEVAAKACESCHGHYGDSSGHDSPRLAGQDAEYLVVALEAYRDGTREYTVMQELSAKLSDTEIINLAAFYASQVPKALTGKQWLTAAEWAQKCDRCHGPGGNSTDPRFPILAGQSEEYLFRALKVYHGETRGSSIMQAMSFALGEADFRNLAAYYSARRAE